MTVSSDGSSRIGKAGGVATGRRRGGHTPWGNIVGLWKDIPVVHEVDAVVAGGGFAQTYALRSRERIPSLITVGSGRFAPLPLEFDGRKLRLNFRTSRGRNTRRSGGKPAAPRCRATSAGPQLLRMLQSPAVPTASRWMTTKPDIHQ